MIGLDDFARRLIGAPSSVRVPGTGDWLHQGGRAFALRLDGKVADLVSPVEGEVIEVNRDVLERPALATNDPYGRGWVLKIKPTTWPRTPQPPLGPPRPQVDGGQPRGTRPGPGPGRVERTAGESPHWG